MALRSIYKSATDEELAALYCLNLLWPSDIEGIAVKWMLEGKGGENVAFLAFEWHTSLSHIETELKRAFDEIQTSIPTEKNALKAIFKFHLEEILRHTNEYMLYLHEIVDLERMYSGKIALFERPDCDEYFQKQNLKYPNTQSSRFAAQEFGIERLYALYYTEDDFDSWTSELEAKRQSAVLLDVKKVLDKFYRNLE